MRTDLEKQSNGWERSSDYVSRQDAEEVITKTAAQKRKEERNRSAKAKRDRDRKILIIAGVSVLLVVILIFSAGKAWQRRVDKKEIDRLTTSNNDLQTQIQDLQKSNAELQNTISSLETQTQSSSNNTTAPANGTTHVLQTGYNFREEPNTDADVLAELDEGVSVTIVSVQDDGWVQAQYNGQTGYLKCGDELSTTSAAGNSNSDNGTTTPSSEAEGEEE